jgi:7-carboxy-7-deazaguanine synthase
MDDGRLRISEIYVSTQGEGPKVGIPTVFVRFGGCNLRCAGWPCDTPYAIDPARYRHEWKLETISQILVEIPRWVPNVCLTGGEPFLQNHKLLQDLVFALNQRGQEVEAFTNGTILYPDWVFTRMITLVMDWKLVGSQEDPFNDNRFLNAKQLKPTDAIKFVVKDRNDFEQAMTLFDDNQSDIKAQWFTGVVWGKLEDSTLVEWMLRAKMPWRLNVQVHNHIWDRSKRGI